MSFKRIGLLLLMAAVVFLSSHFYLKAQTANKTINNIHYLNALESFMLTSQKIRGLTNSYLNGNLSAQLLVHGQREEINKVIDTMQMYQEKSLLDVTEQKEFAQDITGLNHTAFKEDSKIVFMHYTKIINNTIDFSKKLEEKMAQNDASYKPISNVYFPLIENIAKLRGLGSGCVAHGNSTPVENQKLTSFITQIKQLQSTIQGNNYDSQGEQESLDEIFSAINQYIQLSQNEVIHKHAISLKADFYFDEGTAVIDRIVNYLEKKQADQLSKLTHQSNKDSTIALTLIALCLVPLIVIARGLGI